jgi:hypothetical protein
MFCSRTPGSVPSNPSRFPGTSQHQRCATDELQFPGLAAARARRTTQLQATDRAISAESYAIRNRAGGRRCSPSLSGFIRGTIYLTFFYLACSTVRIILNFLFHHLLYNECDDARGGLGVSVGKGVVIRETLSSTRFQISKSIPFRPRHATCRRVFSLSGKNSRACISFKEYPTSQAVLDAPITQNPNSATLP